MAHRKTSSPNACTLGNAGYFSTSGGQLTLCDPQHREDAECSHTIPFAPAQAQVFLKLLHKRYDQGERVCEVTFAAEEAWSEPTELVAHLRIEVACAVAFASSNAEKWIPSERATAASGTVLYNPKSKQYWNCSFWFTPPPMYRGKLFARWTDPIPEYDN